MSRLEGVLAGPEDDSAIRTLLASAPVPGSITLSYEQEPSFFAAQRVLGPFVQTIIGRDVETGAVAALGSRSIRRLYVNGEPQDVGYLSQLRIDSPFRGRWLLSRGFDMLRELHSDGRCDGYVTTIIDGNADAAGVLVDRARPGFPTYREVGRLNVLALLVRGRRPDSWRFRIERGATDRIGEIAAFLAEQNHRRQFAPVWDARDLAPGAASTPGLAPEDFALVLDGETLVAVGAVWDQSSFKQTVVRGYSKGIARTKPLLDSAAAAIGARRLPPVGERISHAYAAMVAVRDDDPSAYLALLDALLRTAGERSLGFLTVGLADGDPLLPLAKRSLHMTYRSRVYTVDWDDSLRSKLDSRPLGLEVACL